MIVALLMGVHRILAAVKDVMQAFLVLLVAEVMRYSPEIILNQYRIASE